MIDVIPTEEPECIRTVIPAEEPESSYVSSSRIRCSAIDYWIPAVAGTTDLFVIPAEEPESSIL